MISRREDLPAQNKTHGPAKEGYENLACAQHTEFVLQEVAEVSSSGCAQVQAPFLSSLPPLLGHEKSTQGLLFHCSFTQKLLSDGVLRNKLLDTAILAASRSVSLIRLLPHVERSGPHEIRCFRHLIISNPVCRHAVQEYCWFNT